MTRTIQLSWTDIHTDEYVDSLEGDFIDESDYDQLISGEDVDVLKPDGSRSRIRRSRRARSWRN